MPRSIPLVTAAVVMTLALADGARAQSFSVRARAGGADGTLVIDAAGIAFQTGKAAAARHWPYAAIRLLEIGAHDQLVVETYDVPGWLGLGRGHTRVRFRVAGEGLAPAAITFLLDRVARPMVTRIMPPALGRAEWTLDVRHERRGDDAAGTLELYASGVAFRGARPEDTRFWRFRDLASVLPLDPFRIELTAREADDLQPFTFQLAEELPAAFRDAVWARINSPAPALRECCATRAGVPDARLPARWGGRVAGGVR